MHASIVDHAVILVTSLDRSLPYYRALLPLLGFREQPDGMWKGTTGFSLKFDEARPDSRPYDRHGAGLNHLGFAAPDPTALTAIAETMAGAGFDVPALQWFDDIPALFMMDPDGLRFEIACQTRETSR